MKFAKMAEQDTKSQENVEYLAVNMYPTPTTRVNRNDSVSSLSFYNDSVPESQDLKPKSWSQENILVQDHVTFSTKQSPRLPVWVWVVITNCLGIPIRDGHRPVFGTMLHVLTFASALIYGLTHIWFEVYAIISIHNRQDVLKRCVSIFMVLIWCALGFYAKGLCGRLFRHPSFLKDVRMHSKTVFKINAAFLMFILGALFVIVNNYNNIGSLDSETCTSVGTDPAVCIVRYVARVVFSVFTLMWNSLVAAVLVSVCRTHTIGVRRFIRDLERDALLYENYNCQIFQDAPLTKEDICQETIWLDEEQSDEEVYVNIIRDGKKDCVPMTTAPKCGPCTTEGNDNSSLVTVSGQRSEGQISENNPVTPHTLSIAEILRSYWKISCRLRLTGIALQRWVASFTSLVIIWCASLLVSWLSTPATVYEIIEFVVPLALLLLTCSAVAEVNVEGMRMLKCICPTKQRLQMMNYFTKNPLQLITFGFAISYGTICTVVLGILVAFTSRLVILEINTT